MKKPSYQQILMGVVGFLVTWQATGFDLDYRSILSSVVSFALGGAAPKKKEPTE